jgi:mRNA interferase MazF
MDRGDIWWASLEEPSGSSPGFRRPIIIVQADAFNQSKINTVIGLVITSNLGLANAPGNISLSKKDSGLPKDSVINVSQIITIDKRYLTEFVKKIRSSIMHEIENGLRLVLDLE